MILYRSQLASLVLSVLLLSTAAAETGLDGSGSQTLEAAEQDFLTIKSFLLPPAGTDRGEVEKIYGQPTRLVEKAKGPVPYFVYIFTNANCSLDVAYATNRVRWARWNVLPLDGNPARKLPDSELASAYRVGETKLKMVRSMHWDHVRLASWNRR